MAGIYIHIPFCRKACIYCDFHFSTSIKNKKLILECIQKEISLRSRYLGEDKVETIYFGGGTPSILSEEDIAGLLLTLQEYFNIENNAEITLEANPDDLQEEYLASLIRTGINRLSIGLQSFNQEELIWMNRMHSVKQNFDCLESALKQGFSNISVDLIYGSKFQSLKTWQESLSFIKELGVDHLSCYSLTAEENTVFGNRIKRKAEMEPNDELSAVQFDYLMDWCESANFEHYEISNFAKNQKYSKHNSSYWSGKKYLGLGPSAHSFNGVHRSKNVSSNSVYIRNVREEKVFCEVEELDLKSLFNESILIGLRTKWGINLTNLKNRFPEFYKHTESISSNEMQLGNLKMDGNQLILTQTGKKFADRIAEKFFII